MRRLAIVAAATVLSLAGPAAGQQAVTVSHALAEIGDPRHGPDFEHFDYADPDAPRGGTITIGYPGTFENLNAIPLAGEFARNVGLLSDTLMAPSQNELSAFYPLIAERVEYPDDLGWIIFHLNPDARFHDGEPITASDVAFSFNAIREHARPFLRAAYDDVASITVLDDHRVRFDFDTRDTMQPLVRVAALSVQPEHWWTAGGRDISRGTLEPPLGSGPYRLAQVDQGRRLVYERVEDYWAADLPTRRGLFNFDRVQYDYYRDADVMFEAFKAGASDFRVEYTSRIWSTGYDTPDVDAGRLVQAELPSTRFRGIQGFFMNTRLPIFEDRRVRMALNHLYPFEWVQRNVMYGHYNRIESYFPGAEAFGYTATGLPEGLELELIEPFRGMVPDEVFTETYRLPENGLRGVTRQNRRAALQLFEEAGWVVRDGRLVNAETGEPMVFEILLRTSALEPHTQPFVQALQQVGIEASVRWVDSAQYQRRYQNREFEMISFGYTFYPPPGGELASYFHSAEADIVGSANLMAIRDPAVDSLLETILTADDADVQAAATRALDRLLQWGYYVVPHWYNDVAWIAYWNRFGFPDMHPQFDIGLPNTIGFQPSWWIDPARDAELTASR